MELSITSKHGFGQTFLLLCRLFIHLKRVYSFVGVVTPWTQDEEASRPTPPAENALINEIIREYSTPPPPTTHQRPVLFLV